MHRTRTKNGWSALGLALVALALSRPAAADPKDDARRHFIAGLAAAQAHDYQTALQEFLAAQDAYPHSASAYNIAKSYADLQDYNNALAWYRLFQEMAPDKATTVQPTIDALEQRLRAAEAPTSAVIAPAAPSSSPAASDADLARLRAIADELARLTADLAARTSAAPETQPEAPETGPPAPVDATPQAVVIPDQGALVSDAYERVVVTASRYGQDPLDSPATVTVLTEQDIRMSGATNLPDVLRRVVGVDVMSLAGSETEVSIRGFNRELSNKVLVLIDGRSVYVDLLSAVFWPLLPISLEEIERIEIIRGPGSAVYGADAMTGVINIITRTPGEGDNLVSVEAGSPAYAQGTALSTGRKDNTSWRMSVGYHQTGRWSQVVDVDAHDNLVPFSEDQSLALQTTRANGRVDRAFADQGFLSLSAGYASGLTEFYGLGVLGDYAFDMQNGYARGDLSYGPVHLRAFYNSVDGRTGPWYQQEGARSLNTALNSDIADLELETRQNFKTGKVAHTVSAGVGYRYKQVEGGYLDDDHQEHHLNAFATEQATLGKVNLVGSLRVDRHPLVPDLSKTLSPRAAAIVRVAPRTSLRVSGGTSFRAPSFLESYLELELPVSIDGVFLRVHGDQDLDPERILTGELGVHDESTAYHTADATLYVNRVTDLIDLSNSVPAVAPFDDTEAGFLAGNTTFINRESVYTGYGIELDGRVFPVDGLDLYANVDLQKIEDETGAPNGSVSFAKINTGVLYRSPWRTDVSAHLAYSSPQTWPLREFDEEGQVEIVEREVAARAVLVARLAARPFKDEALELAITAWNLLALVEQRGFQEHPKGQDVGGRLYGTGTLRF